MAGAAIASDSTYFTSLWVLVTALEHARIHVGPGRRGTNLRIGVDDLVRLTHARVVDATPPA